MNKFYGIATTDHAAFAEALLGSKFDRHVRAYYQHQFKLQIAALSATADARDADMAAGLRALRNVRLGA